MSSPAAEDASSRRTSRRVSRKPKYLLEEQEVTTPARPAKRKRTSKADATPNRENGDDDDDDDVSVDDEDGERQRGATEREVQEGEEEQEGDDNDDDTESSEESHDEYQVRQKRGSRKERPTPAKSSTVKPAAKRPKTTHGASRTLAIRSANIPSKPASRAVKAKARARPSQAANVGLFADVFGKNNNAEEAATAWHENLQKDNVAGIRDLVNFILQCIGCDLTVDSSDIEDVDNVNTKLGDVLEEYANQNHADYPLSAKSKQHAGMKEVLGEFFRASIHALHNSGLLYEDQAVYDNIHLWTATMSGAKYRSFRHTATVISLANTTALTELARELQESMATTKQQIETEKKKKSVNKNRVEKLTGDMKAEQSKMEMIEAWLSDAFDVVYVHRYRDVDERIRVECVTALGEWIINYRKMFLEGQFLRYLGFVLSDPNAPTRLEVVRQLKRLFKQKQNVPALRAFIDRFRSRIVEMGARDADLGVRIEAIEFLDKLRNAELLEPEDIETIGQLIFDNEPRIRKAVAQFFVSNIEDLYASGIESFEKEEFEEALPALEDVDDFLDPNSAWIKFKCLAQTLTENGRDNPAREGPDRTHDVYGTEEVDSRYMLAAQSIYPFMPELEHWESLAGYLLYDHSSVPKRSRKSDLSSSIKEAYRLGGGEDIVLLEVLVFAVKLSLDQLLDLESEKRGKKTKKSKDDARQKQEQAAHHLTIIIPQLLNKFGSAPEAATSILRLEQLLNVDLINDLQSGEATFAALLDDINKQFNSHNDRKVLAEASRALRTARSYETSKDAADAKVAEMWTEANRTVVSLFDGKDITSRGSLDSSTLQNAADTMSRLAQLASISDCCDALESRMSWRKAQSNGDKKGTFIETLIALVGKGIKDHSEGTIESEADSELEDQLVTSTITVLSFYFRWKMVMIKGALATDDARGISTGMLTNLSIMKHEFVEQLLLVISSRAPLNSARVNAILTLMDMYVLFATLRHLKPSGGSQTKDKDYEVDDQDRSNLSSLASEIDKAGAMAIIESHEKMEKRLAKWTKSKKIQLPLEAEKRRRKSSHVDDSDVDDDETDHGGANRTRRNDRNKGKAARQHDEESDSDIEKPPEDSDSDLSDADDDRRTNGHNRGGGDHSSDIDTDSDDGGIGAIAATMAEVDQNGNGSSATREGRKQATLLSEQALCEFTSKMVLGVIGGVLPDTKSIKARLQINRTKLGKSYAQIIAYLDDDSNGKKKGGKSKGKAKARFSTAPAEEIGAGTIAEVGGDKARATTTATVSVTPSSERPRTGKPQKSEETVIDDGDEEGESEGAGELEDDRIEDDDEAEAEAESGDVDMAGDATGAVSNEEPTEAEGEDDDEEGEGEDEVADVGVGVDVDVDPSAVTDVVTAGVVKDEDDDDDDEIEDEDEDEVMGE